MPLPLSERTPCCFTRQPRVFTNCPFIYPPNVSSHITATALSASGGPAGARQLVFGPLTPEGHLFDPRHRRRCRVLILQIRNETGPLVAFHLRKGAFVLLFCVYCGMHCDDDVRRARKAPSKLANTHLSFPCQFCSIIHKYLTTYLYSIKAHVDAPSHACINKCFAATPSIHRKKKLLSRS